MEQQEDMERENERSNNPAMPRSSGIKLSMPMAVIIAGALIAGAIYMSGTQRSAAPVAAVAGAGQQVQQSGQPIPQVADISKVKTTGEPFIGNPNAPVTIAYWYDYQCPFCQRNEETTMPQVIKDYVDTGKAKIVFKDFEFLGPDSQTLGEYARAVWNVAPDKFYTWHKAVYDNQGTENTGWATKEKILSITTQALGSADANKVVALVTTNSSSYQTEMDADKAEGSAFGVQGTPAFIIGKQLISGAQPYSALKTAIDGVINGK